MLTLMARLTLLLFGTVLLLLAPTTALVVAGGSAAAPSPLAASVPAGRRKSRVLRVRLTESLRGARQRPRALALVSTDAATAVAAAAAVPPPPDAFGTIYVGTPPREFSVKFDTGSGDVVLPSVTCRSVACMARRPYDIMASNSGKEATIVNARGGVSLVNASAAEFALGRGNVSGDTVADVVCLGAQGELCARTNMVVATRMPSDPFSYLPYDGIVGLGLPEGSLGRSFNFMQALVETGAVESELFAVWLASPSDSDASEVTFGGYSADRIGAGGLRWLPLSTSAAAAGRWQVPLTEIVVDSVGISVCGGSTGGCEAALDTGTTGIAAPAEVVKVLSGVLDIRSDCSNYASLPLLGFVIGDLTLNLEAADYVRRVGNQCVHQFLAIDGLGKSGITILLGTPFLRRYYTVYDYSTHRVGLALARHRETTGTPDEVAARLIKSTAAAAAAAP